MQYDLTEVPGKYVEGRRLSPEAFHLWMTTLSTHIEARTIRFILDLGCGTGRFSQILGDYFKARVVGVEPSEKMRDQTRPIESATDITFKKGSAESIPLEDQVADLIFMSQAFHHIEDREAAALETFRVAKKKGWLAVRNSTRENLPHMPYLKHFPEAMDVNEGLLPFQKDIEKRYAEAGFEWMATQSVSYEIAPNMAVYFEKTKQRVNSDLSLISDVDFEAGVQRMKEKVDLNNPSPIFEQADLFIFRKPG